MRIIQTLIILLLIFFQTVTATAEIIDRIVAVVNDDVITLSELNDEGKDFFQAIIKNTQTQRLQDEINTARHKVLNKLIDQLIIQQEANKFNITASEEDVDRSVDSILANNNITKEQFLRSLHEMGASEQAYRNKLKQKILRNRLINFEIKSKVVITDKRVEQYYNEFYKNSASNSNTDGYHIIQIGLLWGDKYKSKTQQEARSNAEKLRSMLASGKNFSEMAKSFSDLPSAEDGGDIGVFADNELAPYMRKAIVTMRPGEVSQVLETPVGYQILKLKSAKGGSEVVPLEDVAEEIKTTLYKQEVEKSYDTWVNDLRAKAFIKRNL